jgi:hypothetical protein
MIPDGLCGTKPIFSRQSTWARSQRWKIIVTRQVLADKVLGSISITKLTTEADIGSRVVQRFATDRGVE